MGDKLRKFEAFAEIQADGLLERVRAWQRTAAILALVLFLTHLAAFILGLVAGS
jgi:hypothetical protein